MGVSICITHLSVQLLQLEDLPAHHCFSQESTTDLGLHVLDDDVVSLRSNTMQVYCSHNQAQKSSGSERLNSSNLLSLPPMFLFESMCNVLELAEVEREDPSIVY